MADRYTRVVLTVIAVCLVIIAAKGTVDRSYAAHGDNVHCSRSPLCAKSGHPNLPNSQ
jgi:hypothetical protein